MSAIYKLTYFDITALGEPIRLLLSYGKCNFEDKRVTFEQWPVLKGDMPYGQLPTLEYKGKVAHQSMAICRYLGKQVKLDGGSDWENLEIDAAADTVSDFRAKIALYHYEKDLTVKETRRKALFDETIPFYLKKFAEQIQKNNGHLACEKLTWADFYLAGVLDYLNNMLGEDLSQKCPELKTVQEKVHQLPELQDWLQKHPKNEV